jgi:hypothetical protein
MRSTLFGLLLAVILATTPSAQAKIPAIIGWGEQVADVSDLPKELADSGEAGATALKVGYLYSSIRVFWVPLVTWGGKYVVFQEKGGKTLVEEIPTEARAEVEKQIGGNLASKGGLHAWWARWVNWLWVVVVALFIAKKLMGSRSSTGPLQYPTQQP